MLSPELLLVTFLPTSQTVSAHSGDTLLDAALDNAIPLEHECGGNCCCTTCLVRVANGHGNLSVMQPPEQERLMLEGKYEDGCRLACQAILHGTPVTVSLVETD